MTRETESPLRLTRAQQTVELLRPWLPFALYLAAASAGWWLLAVPVAFAACLAAFVQMHDAIHHSLGLSRRGHDLVISASGLHLNASEIRSGRTAVNDSAGLLAF